MSGRGAALTTPHRIAEEFPERRRPLGLLVGDRLDNEAHGMVDDDDRLQFIALDDLQ